MVGDVLDLTKSKTNIIDEITNGIIVTKINNILYCYVKKDNEVLCEWSFGEISSCNIKYNISDEYCDIIINDILIYENYKMDYNTILFAAITNTINVKNIQLYSKNKVIDDFTEKVDEYDGKTFGRYIL